MPVLDVDPKHPALKGNSGIKASAAWRDAEAARKAGLLYEEFWQLPINKQVTVVAQYEIAWRIEALQGWEHQQRIKTEQKTKPKPSPKRKRL